MQQRNKTIKLLEWSLAADPYLEIDKTPTINVIEHDRSKETTLHLPIRYGQFVYNDKEKIEVGTWLDGATFSPGDWEFQLTILEREMYSEIASNEFIRYMYDIFVNHTGILRADIHIAKRVFSNGKATIVVIITEKEHNYDNQSF